MNFGIRLASAFIGITFIAGCGQPSSTPVAPAAASEAKASDLDTYRGGDLAFFERFKLENALTLPPPASVSVAAEQSTAVVLAEVADVENGQTIVGDGTHDVMAKVGVVLRNVEVLDGALQPELKGRVVVELMLPDGADKVGIESLKTELPSGKSVWFLHWLGSPPAVAKLKPGAVARPAHEQQLYGLISMQGVFVQGSDRVVSAVAEEHGPSADMATDGAQFKKLSELVTKVRELK
jgi:hypothetical protein